MGASPCDCATSSNHVVWARGRCEACPIGPSADAPAAPLSLESGVARASSVPSRDGAPSAADRDGDPIPDPDPPAASTARPVAAQIGTGGSSRAEKSGASVDAREPLTAMEASGTAATLPASPPV